MLGGGTAGAGRLDETRAGVDFGYQTRTGSGVSAFVSGSAVAVDDTDGANRDGSLYTIEAGISRAFGARGTLGFVLSGENYDAAREDFSYTSLEARLTHEIDITGGISLSSSAFVETYDQDTATPGFPDTRQETEYGVDFRAEKTDLFIAGRFTPYVEVGASRRESSFEAYSYDDLRFGAGIESAF